jgi:hypothetical protein
MLYPIIRRPRRSLWPEPLPPTEKAAVQPVGDVRDIEINEKKSTEGTDANVAENESPVSPE